MAGNTAPIWSKAGGIAGVEITAANTKSDGTGTIGTDIFLVGTVDATNGGFVRAVEWWPTATAAGTATTATMGRVFASSVSSGTTTVSNTHPQGEVALASQTADQTTTATFPIVVPLNKAYPAGTSILATNHAAPAANTKWKAVLIYGSY